MKKIEEWAISQQSLIMDFQVGYKNSGFKMTQFIQLKTWTIWPFVGVLLFYSYTHTYTQTFFRELSHIDYITYSGISKLILINYF